MRLLIVSAFLALAAAAPASADQGCIEVSTTTVTTTVCAQFDCVHYSDGACVQWNCSRTQTTTYVDSSASGCTRLANCGSRALFVAGPPQQDSTDSSENCDWYPCVQADPATHACLFYMCVSKRVFETVRTTYPSAKCVPMVPARPAPDYELRSLKPEKGDAGIKPKKAE